MNTKQLVASCIASAVAGFVIGFSIGGTFNLNFRAVVEPKSDLPTIGTNAILWPGQTNVISLSKPTSKLIDDVPWKPTYTNIVILRTHETKRYNLIRVKEHDDFEKTNRHDLNPYLEYCEDWAHPIKVTNWVIGFLDGTNEVTLLDFPTP